VPWGIIVNFGMMLMVLAFAWGGVVLCAQFVSLRRRAME